jgi:hypothetical protein
MGSKVQQITAELETPWNQLYTARMPMEVQHNVQSLRVEAPYLPALHRNVNLTRAVTQGELRELQASCVVSSMPVLEALDSVYRFNNAELLSQGGHAITYKVPWKEVRKLSRAERVSKDSILRCEDYRDEPENSTVVVLKVTKLASPYLMHASIREAVVHNEICYRKAPGTDWLPPVEGRQVVPEFYRGLIVRPQRSCPLYIIAMEHIEGATLHRWKQLKPDISPTLFANVEKAVKSLWCLGYTHCDMHNNNILVRQDESVRLIDLAQAVPLQYEIRAQIRTTLTPWTDVAALYLDDYMGIQAYNRRIISMRIVEKERDPRTFYPEAIRLLALRKKLQKETTLADMQVQRLKAWWPRARVVQFLAILENRSGPLDASAWRRLLGGN